MSGGRRHHSRRWPRRCRSRRGLELEVARPPASSGRRICSRCGRRSAPGRARTKRVFPCGRHPGQGLLRDGPRTGRCRARQDGACGPRAGSSAPRKTPGEGTAPAERANRRLRTNSRNGSSSIRTMRWRVKAWRACGIGRLSEAIEQFAPDGQRTRTFRGGSESGVAEEAGGGGLAVVARARRKPRPCASSRPRVRG